MESEVKHMYMFAFGEGEAVASQSLLWLCLNKHVNKSELSNKPCLHKPLWLEAKYQDWKLVPSVKAKIGEIEISFWEVKRLLIYN